MFAYFKKKSRKTNLSEVTISRYFKTFFIYSIRNAPKIMPPTYFHHRSYNTNSYREHNNTTIG